MNSIKTKKENPNHTTNLKLSRNKRVQSDLKENHWVSTFVWLMMTNGFMTAGRLSSKWWKSVFGLWLQLANKNRKETTQHKVKEFRVCLKKWQMKLVPVTRCGLALSLSALKYSAMVEGDKRRIKEHNHTAISPKMSNDFEMCCCN